MSENQEYPDLVIRLVGLQETNWVMEGTEKSEHPLRMSWPGQFRIPPTSKYRQDIPEGGYKLVAIRHIDGCDLIDPKAQETNGFKPTEMDNIWLSGGTGTFKREGSTIGTYDYLKKFEGNKNNPLRPPEAEIMFEEVVAVDIAIKNNRGFDIKAEAYGILRDIRQPQDDGSFIYNQEKLGLLTTLFNMGHLDTADEKFTELYRIVEDNPKLIVESIVNGKKKLFALIKQAEDLAVIGFNDDRVYLTATNTAIIIFKGAKAAKNTQINKLADFLLTEEGRPFMQQVVLSVESAAVKSLERTIN